MSLENIQGTTIDDRRRHTRTGYRGRVWLADTSNTYWGRLVDVSRAGVSIEIDGRTPSGGTLRLGFDLPRGGRVFGNAIITRRGPYRLGLKFVDLDADSTNALAQFVVA